jgi:HD-like signal output (HDOD) protein
LGEKTLKELIMLASASGIFSRRLKGYNMDADSMWRHSISVAYGSKLIANMTSPDNVHDAFTAGLIHDVGKLILDKYVYARKERFDTHQPVTQNRHLETERKIFGFDHAILAERVCVKWNFPNNIAMAVKYHHMPNKMKNSQLAHIVHASDSLVSWIGLDVDGIALDVDDDSLERLGIQTKEIDTILDEIIAYANTVIDIINA